MNKKITIALVSFVQGLSDKERLILTLDTINAATTDIMLFCGHTIGLVKDIEKLKEEITNTHTEVILELESINSYKIENCLYRLYGGELRSMHTSQLFSTSNEIEGNCQLADYLLNEFITRRSFNSQGMNVLVIQCGELNILKNLQAKKNKVVIRVHHDRELTKLYQDLFNQTHLFLNPIHTPMGNQGKMDKRRIFLSKNKKYYFSSSNTAENNKLDLKSLQYAYYDGKPLEANSEMINTHSLVRTFDIVKIG